MGAAWLADLWESVSVQLRTGLVASVRTVATSLALILLLARPSKAGPVVPVEPTFASTVSPLDSALRSRMTGVSWRPGCPVGLHDLRLLQVTYWGFDGQAHTGPLVVHRRHTAALQRVFRKLFYARFPIEKVRLIDDYNASDDAAVFDNNTSAFNCRKVEVTNSKNWSQHSYGGAIDINPLQNPYVYRNGTALDPSAQPYVDRNRADPGMIHAGDVVVRAFATEGWGWGGNFRGAKDWQHFSSNAR